MNVDTQNALPVKAQAKLDILLLQALSILEGMSFDEACIDPDDPHVFCIRLGRALNFIARIHLSDGHIIRNMNCEVNAVRSPTQIVEIFKPFGASTGQEIADKICADFIGGRDGQYEH